MGVDFIYTDGGQRIVPVYDALNPRDTTLDAFNRKRSSTPTTLFDSKQLHNNAPLFWDDAETDGGGTGSSHSTATAATTITVGATTAGTRVRQTFQRFNYQPGKSQLVMMTGVLGAGATGITRRIGYFDAGDGLYFQLSGSTLSVCRRTSVSGSPENTAVAQDDWNLDTLDGTGPSGVTIDTSKAQIFFIDFEWLGTGSVRYGFIVDGVMIACHVLQNANNLTTVYMSTPNLPLRYEIDNDGTGAAASLVHICSTVISEGGNQETGLTGYVSTLGTHVNANTADALYPIVGIRLSTAALDTRIDILSVSLLAETNDNYEWVLTLNPTIASTAWAFAAVSNFSIERALGSSAITIASTAPGTLLAGGWGAAKTDNAQLVYNQRHLGADIAGVRDVIVLAARPLAANADIQGGISFREW